MSQTRNQVDPTQVTLNLLELSRQLQKLSDELDGLEERAVNAKEEYTVAYAKTFLASSGSVEVRKQMTLLETSDQRLQAELAETLVKAHVRKISTLKVRIDVGRSAAALVRAESEMLRINR